MSDFDEVVRRTSAWRSGYAAAQRGLAIVYCPFNRRTLLYRVWRDGWAQGIVENAP